MGELQRTVQAPHGAEDASSIGREDAASIGRIEALIPRVLSASEEERARLGEELNVLLLRLPSEPQREASAALLRRLVDERALEGLGTEKMPASIAATKALLDLGYPSALEVDPQQLDALRRWERERTRVPWFPILMTLFVVAIAQIAVITLGSPGAPPHDMTSLPLDVLAGVEPLPPSWLIRYVSFLEDSALTVLGYQFLAGAAAFLFTGAFARWPTGRVLARLTFLLLFGLGTLVSVLQLPASLWMAGATFLPAVGAFISATLLKSR
ncbi:hypothetical protein [Myxococcus eversor]|uniref:hypothetical protein n=1 Tax=Myxococcus eversor TaxID=2709661 RepID=UPI0013CF6C9F|nr:hypothetical protein [Myxococcus eversor]